MPAAAPHPDESDRLSALQALEILDSAPEEMFDQLVELTSRMLGTPIALLSLVDKDRQWFKARAGLDASETSRTHSFCAHAILNSEHLLVVADATADPRFVDNPLVTGEPGIRFYAGAPIVSPFQALPLGTLCVIDQVPREPTEHELETLRLLAKQVEHLLAYRTVARDSQRAARSLAESEAKVRGIIDNSRSFIGLMRIDGTLIDANRTSLAAAGVPAERVLGKAFWETPWWTHSESLRERLKKAVRRAAAGEKDGFEATHPTPDGNVINVDFSISPIFVNGEVVYLLPEGRDITERKQREGEIQRYMAALKETNHDLEQFAYVASHDLRSPLRGIGGIASFIEEDDGARLSAASRDHLKDLQQRVRRMQNLLDDLLDYSRIGRIQEQPQDVDVARLVREIVDLLPTPSKMRIEVLPTMPRLLTHVAPLRQVLLNLIGNAVKHHDKPDGRISISATACTAEDSQGPCMYAFRVADDGPGIDPAFHDQIFELFRTLRPQDDTGGSGMGLAITRKLVRRYCGDVRVESQPGQGTTFIFTWPKSVLAGEPA